MYNRVIEVDDIMLDNYKKEIEKVSNMDKSDFKSYVAKREFSKREENTLVYLAKLEENIMKNISNLNHDLETLHDVISSYKFDMYLVGKNIE